MMKRKREYTPTTKGLRWIFLPSTTTPNNNIMPMTLFSWQYCWDQQRKMMVLKKLLLLQERRRSARSARALTNPPMASSFAGGGSGDNVGNTCTSIQLCPVLLISFHSYYLMHRHPLWLLPAQLVMAMKMASLMKIWNVSCLYFETIELPRTQYQQDRKFWQFSYSTNTDSKIIMWFFLDCWRHRSQPHPTSNNVIERYMQMEGDLLTVIERRMITFNEHWQDKF